MHGRCRKQLSRECGLEMWKHYHPYPPYIFSNTTRLIVGTLPPPRFSIGTLNAADVDFCYGSSNGMLWKIWDRLYGLNLKYENTAAAIAQRKAFLKREGIGICDIVAAAYRKKIDASDLGMEQVELRNLLQVLKEHPKINTLIFTGGNSKNGPEYFFRQLLKQAQLKLLRVSHEVPRKHEFIWEGRRIVTYSLTAPSGAANRAIGSRNAFKQKKIKNPNYTTFDFRVEQYGRVFEV